MKPGAPAQIENWGGPPLPAVVDRVEPVARTKISRSASRNSARTSSCNSRRSEPEPLQAHDFRVDVRVS